MMKQETARKRRRPFSSTKPYPLSLESENNSNGDESCSSPPSVLQCSQKPALKTKQKQILTILLLIFTTYVVSFARITTRRHSQQFSAQLSKASPPKSCSCWNTSDKCCDRKILRAHKMGVVLIRDLIQHPLGVESAIILPSEITNQTKPDYRHVVITRPIYDSIISGYLYHKSGRECWLDQHGLPRVKNKTFDWEPKLSFPLSPPGLNRTLCSYLAQESESDGIRAVVDLALSAWYSGLVPHYELVEQMEMNDNRHTLFVCFEELSNTATQQATIQRITDWLYPGGHSFSQPPRIAKQASTSYKGGHSTSVDATVRKRLYDLVRRHDMELFNGMGTKASNMFGCDKKSVSI